MNEPVVGTPDVFLETQEYRRFVEFCEACRQYRYIGLCHGPPGVGKTLSARHYAQWDWVEPVLATQRAYRWEPVPRALTDCHTLLYTPTVMVTPRQVTEELNKLQRALQLAIARVLAPNVEPVELMVQALPQRTELVIVDEADRLKFSTLELLRDCYDRGGFGLGRVRKGHRCSHKIVKAITQRVRKLSPRLS